MCVPFSCNIPVNQPNKACPQQPNLGWLLGGNTALWRDQNTICKMPCCGSWQPFCNGFFTPHFLLLGVKLRYIINDIIVLKRRWGLRSHMNLHCDPLISKEKNADFLTSLHSITILGLLMICYKIIWMLKKNTFDFMMIFPILSILIRKY